jgi:hypothetical protein
MIPQKSTIKRTDTTVGREIYMQIAPEATEEIMEYLIKLYSDPEMACIREAATNARDSHILAGQTKPIEITTPSKLLPVLIIKDYGVGLNEEDFDLIYSRYGISTKRESNEFNGTLGLGCKSPLAYVDQFTVIGIKDGVCTTVSVARHENRGATMKIIDASPTDEPNGVEIQIPARPDNEFFLKAEKLFQFWEEGTVLLDGKVPPRLKGTEVNKRLFLTQDLAEHYVVMGNVPYPITSEFEGLTGGFRLVAYVEMGEVAFTPSREALEMNDDTKTVIEGIKQEFTAALTDTIQREIDGQENSRQALERMTQWRDQVASVFLGDITYRGQVIPKEFRRVTKIPAEGEVPASEKGHDILITTHVESEDGSHHICRSIGTNKAPKYLYVENWTGVKFNINHKRKLQKYLTAMSGGYTLGDNFVLTKERFVEVEPWMDASRFLDWNKIKMIRIETPRRTDGASRNMDVSFDGRRPGREYIADIRLSEIVEAQQVFYYIKPGSYYRGGRSESFNSYYAKPLLAQYPEAYLIELTKNRVERFKREVPHAIPVEKAFEKFSKEAKRIRKDDLRALKFKEEYPGIDDLDPEKVKDPNLRKAIKVAKREVPAVIANLFEATDALKSFGYSVKIPSADIFDPFEPYPLLHRRNPWGERKGGPDLDHDHFYIYVNAVHQQKKKEARTNVTV